MKHFYTIAPLLLMLCLLGCTASPAQQHNFQFTYRGTVIAIDAEAAPVVAALGEPKTYTEEASCVFDGLDKTYSYGSFYLATYPKDGKDYISRIWFTDDSVSTPEGIRIGASQKDVEQAYGEKLGTQNSFTFVQKDSKLTVLLEEGAVTSIQYERIFD